MNHPLTSLLSTWPRVVPTYLITIFLSWPLDPETSGMSTQIAAGRLSAISSISQINHFRIRGLGMLGGILNTP